MTTDGWRGEPRGGAYELVDNGDFGTHEQALEWLARNYGNALNVATGYVSLEGLDALARIASGRGERARLLIGASPSSEDLVGSLGETLSERFAQSVRSLARERDFSAFPASRREVLERVTEFVGSVDVETRRYARGFLHGKAHIFGEFGGRTLGAGAAVVSSANLTAGGLRRNLELGMAHYQPNVVRMALEWYERLWEEAEDFREALLGLLRPPLLDSDPETVFFRALLELYGDDLGEESEGGFGQELTDFQWDGHLRAKRILNRYGGVLYADGVGMGKTEIGIQFIREHARDMGQHVLVIAPAQLRDRLWRQRLSEENLPGDVVSYQELSQDRQLSEGVGRALRVSKDVYRLVVVDEAHAYRNVDNSWYKALGLLMGDPEKKLLLLTATPVNNSLWDLHNLFLLFARHDNAFIGEPLRIPSLRSFFAEASRGEGFSEARLFPLIDALTVRRDRAFIKERYGNERFADGTRVKFPEPELHERRYDLDSAHPGIVQAVYDGIEGLTMARYRRSAYLLDGEGESASEEALAGLMRSQLLKRFESSWHAALRTVERMREGNEQALRGAMGQGEAPVPDARGELWGDFAEDDSFLSADLVDDALAGAGGGVAGEGFSEQFLVDLRRDGAALGRMSALLRSLRGVPDPKLDALREIMASTPSRKVAIFTAFQDTASYLREQIEARPELVNGRSWTSAIGSETDAGSRMREVERFCPESAGGGAGWEPPGGEVDVLLSTDILSEGQNLQQAQAVVSFDMPWNPQRVVQRNGRIIRLRSPHDTAYLYTMLPKQGDLDRLLKLESKIQAKVRAASASVGMETPVLASVEVESQVYADLTRFVERLAGGDAGLLDERESGVEGGSASAGEYFRWRLRRAAQEGEAGRLRGLPWGIGAAFARRSGGTGEGAVFFACRTRGGDRYWRMVSRSGEVLHRDDLPMLQLIDPGREVGVPIPEDIDLGGLFAVAAADICAAHNALLDPSSRFAALPAVQRWALDVLRSPGAPDGREFDEADGAFSVGRGAVAQRELSKLRREYEGGGMSVRDCARRIVAAAGRLGLRPVGVPKAPERITEDDLGVVCYQVVLPPQGKGG